MSKSVGKVCASVSDPRVPPYGCSFLSTHFHQADELFFVHQHRDLTFIAIRQGLPVFCPDESSGMTGLCDSEILVPCNFMKIYPYKGPTDSSVQSLYIVGRGVSHKDIAGPLRVNVQTQEHTYFQYKLCLTGNPLFRRTISSERLYRLGLCRGTMTIDLQWLRRSSHYNGRRMPMRPFPASGRR